MDDQIKLVRRELIQLKQANDAVDNQHAQELLELQRVTASLTVNSDVDTVVSIIDNQLRDKVNRNRVVTDAAEVKSKISTSEKPLRLSTEFRDKWWKILNDKGADFVTY